MGSPLREQVPNKTLAAWYRAPSLPSQPQTFGSATLCSAIRWKTAFEGRRTTLGPPPWVGLCCPTPHPGFWGS